MPRELLPTGLKHQGIEAAHPDDKNAQKLAGLGLGGGGGGGEGQVAPFWAIRWSILFLALGGSVWTFRVHGGFKVEGLVEYFLGVGILLLEALAV